MANPLREVEIGENDRIDETTRLDGHPDNISIRTEYDQVSEKVAAEVLNHAQAMIAAQHAALDTLDSKLSTTLGQSVVLSTAALGAATLPWGDDAWMPLWAGIGLLAAGACAACAVLTSLRGLGPHRWIAPGIPPRGMNEPSVLLATPQTAMMFMAWGYQKGIDENGETTKSLTRNLRWALRFLAAVPLVGTVAAGVAAAAVAYARLGIG